MSQKPHPFSAAYSHLDARRVRVLLDSKEYARLAAMIRLSNQLQGEQGKLLNIFWAVAWEAVRNEVTKAGYSDEELTAAIFVTTGQVLPPR